MNRKGFINVALVVLVVFLAGIVVYLIWAKKLLRPTEISTTTPISTLTPTPTSTPQSVNWESLMPSIRTALRQEFLGIRLEESRPISIFKKTDITADGVPEALVSLGTSGATTDLLTLVRIENNQPVVAHFKQKDGKISSLIFTIGAGGAGRYGSTVEMLKDKNALYSTNHSAYNENNDYCKGEVYQWNSQTKTFEFNTSLSDEVQRDYCSRICTNIPLDLSSYFSRICR